MLAAGGFDPARDVEAITVNRWPHGYTYNYNTLSDPVEWALGTPDDRPCVVGRRRFGRIAITNADAAASSHTDAAIDMALSCGRRADRDGEEAAVNRRDLLKLAVALAGACELEPRVVGAGRG